MAESCSVTVTVEPSQAPLKGQGVCAPQHGRQSLSDRLTVSSKAGDVPATRFQHGLGVLGRRGPRSSPTKCSGDTMRGPGVPAARSRVVMVGGTVPRGWPVVCAVDPTKKGRRSCSTLAAAPRGAARCGRRSWQGFALRWRLGRWFGGVARHGRRCRGSGGGGAAVPSAWEAGDVARAAGLGGRSREL